MNKLNDLVSKFYEKYEVQVKESELSYVRWWSKPPISLEVTTSFLDQEWQSIKSIVTKELVRIPFSKNKLNIPVAIISVVSVFAGVSVNIPSQFSFYVVTTSPLVFLYSGETYIWIYLKYLLIAILPVLLARIPYYYQRYTADLFLYDKLGLDEWKSVHSQYLHLLSHKSPWYSQWYSLMPTQIMVLHNTINKRNIDLKDL